MSKKETFAHVMDAGKTWAAIVGVLIYFTDESIRVPVGGLASIIFWAVIAIYFYWDYRKAHKKSRLKEIGLEPSIVPLTPETVESTKPKKSSNKKWIFIKNTFFIVLGIAESAYCLSLVSLWEIVTIPVDGINIPVLTYQNGILLGIFAFGLIIIVDIAKRLRHPRKAFFEE